MKLGQRVTTISKVSNKQTGYCGHALILKDKLMIFVFWGSSYTDMRR